MKKQILKFIGLIAAGTIAVSGGIAIFYIIGFYLEPIIPLGPRHLYSTFECVAMRAAYGFIGCYLVCGCLFIIIMASIGIYVGTKATWKKAGNICEVKIVK